MGIEVVRIASAGDRLVDRRDWSESDRPRAGCQRVGTRMWLRSHSLNRDVSILPGVGRHLGSRWRAKAPIQSCGRRGMAQAGQRIGKAPAKCQPSSRTGENPPYGR
jgi:hypothetical protein